MADEAESARVDVRPRSVSAVAIPTSDVTENRNVRAIHVDAIATACLSDVSSASVITLRLVDNKFWSVCTTPTFRVVLSTCENVASGTA